MQRRSGMALAALAMLSLLACACTRRTDEVRILAAASLVDVLTALSPVVADVGLPLRCSFGASSQVRAQVEHGAPADLLITASADDARTLVSRQMARAADVHVLYRNQLVVVAPVTGTLRTLDDLRVRGRVGLGDPRAVPAGRYAEQSLRRLGLWDALEGRRVLGSDVRVVLGWVARGEVDAAVVYDTDARAASARVRRLAALPDDTHDPIVYAAVIPAHTANRAGAEALLRALASPRALDVARAHGFEPVMAPPSGEEVR